MIPNYLEDVKAAQRKYPAEWKAAHVDGHPKRYDFIVLLARDLYQKDTNVGCNGKRGDPRNLSMDALNIIDPEDGPGRTPNGKRCWVVDVIARAGGSNPEPMWGAFSDPVASSGAWVHPMAVMLEPEPVKSKILPKGEAFAKLQALNAFYQAPEGLQRPGGLIIHDSEGRSVADMEAIAQWFYQLVVEGIPLEDVFTQIRSSDEWRSKHGEL